MALDRLRPSLPGVLTALMFGSLIVQVQSFVPCDLNRPNILKVGPSTPPFNIESPGFGKSNYPDNLHCSYVVESGMHPVALLFFFTNFSVEFQAFCGYDWLCLFGVRYCGYWEAGFVFQGILPAFSTLTIVFRTDSSVTRPGFSITVIPQPVAIGQTIQQARGIGSSHSIIRFTPITYSPGNPYIDECTFPRAGDNRFLLRQEKPTEGSTVTEIPTTTGRRFEKFDPLNYEI